MTAIHQFLTSYAYGDAIGNETMVIRDYLRSQGFESEIFAQHYHPRYASQITNYKDYARFSHTENIVIYHFSIGSPVSKTFLRLDDRKVIIYHNITPHHFFLDYHRVLAKDCYKGRVELKNLAGIVDLALGDSRHNELELIEAGFPKTAVLPLVMDFKKFDQAVHPVVRELIDDGKVNIIYVGRIIPNKKIEDVLTVFHLYQKLFNPESRLILVGEYRGFERYHSALMKKAQALGTRNLHVTGHIPEDELVSYYKMADLTLHLSEHEGFCAPVPESYHLGKPVIAFDAGAVADTMAGSGLLLRRKDPLRIAALMDIVLKDSEIRERLVTHQRQVLNRFSQEKTGEILLALLAPLIRGS
jgi:glycosyltransferase involved in cell wall biosynthesis